MKMLSHHEYWPQWTIYSPVYLNYVINSLKTKSMMYPFVVNPLMEMSGFVGEDKFKIIQALPAHSVPTTHLLKFNIPLEKQFSWQEGDEWVAKPNQGERGLGVRKIKNFSDLLLYHQAAPRDYILQKYLNLPIEFGVFFVRTPSNPKGTITSLCTKEPITVMGDGTSTVMELCLNDPRQSRQIERLKDLISPHSWDEVPQQNEIYHLDVIRNHRRGSSFKDARHLITEDMQKTFQDLFPENSGFNYGRIDLRAQSIKDFQEGRNFKIIEVNGVTSEPGEIYDPSMSLKESVSILKRHWQFVYEIGSHKLLEKTNSTPKIRDVYSMLKSAITRPAFRDR